MVNMALYFVSVFKKVLSRKVSDKPYREMNRKPLHSFENMKVIFVVLCTYILLRLFMAVYLFGVLLI